MKEQDHIDPGVQPYNLVLERMHPLGIDKSHKDTIDTTTGIIDVPQNHVIECPAHIAAARFACCTL
jgi:hypothetical protein